MATDGAMVEAVQAAVKAVRVGGLDAVGEARAALAVTLARQLDAGAGLATAAVSRELRATLDALPVLSEEASAVDDLAARRAARRANASGVERPASGDVGGPGGGRAGGKRRPRT